MRVRCVGAVVLDEAGRLLLVRRANPPAAGRWSVPGGRVEDGESDDEAVRREVREETGLDVTVDRRLGSVEIPSEDGATVYAVEDYLCRPMDAREPAAGDDATEAGWADRTAFEQLDLVDGLHDALARWHVLPR